MCYRHTSCLWELEDHSNYVNWVFPPEIQPKGCSSGLTWSCSLKLFVYLLSQRMCKTPINMPQGMLIVADQ